MALRIGERPQLSTTGSVSAINETATVTRTVNRSTVPETNTPKPLGVVNQAPAIDAPNVRTGPDGNTQELGRWAADKRKAAAFKFEPYATLFGGDQPLAKNRSRLLNSYFDDAVGGKNAESAARVGKYYDAQKTAGAKSWAELGADEQRGFVEKNREGLWSSLDTSERAMFLSGTRALSELKVGADRSKSALDFVDRITDIHGAAPMKELGRPDAAPLGRDRLGVLYTDEGKKWLQSGGSYYLASDGGREKKLGHHGIHSLHKGFDDWVSDNRSPNLQWQFRSKDNYGEIDLDYEHKGLYLKANTSSNSDILNGGHLKDFEKKYGNPGFSKR